MGTRYTVKCNKCGTTFHADEGGGLRFHLLHCDKCGGKKSISFEALKTHIKYRNLDRAQPPQTGQLMDGPTDLPYLKIHWEDFINSMRGEGSGGNLYARLRHACEPVEIKGDNLALGFYHEFHKQYIDDRKYLHLIEKKLKEVFGHSYTVTCVMLSQEQKSEIEGFGRSIVVAKYFSEIENLAGRCYCGGRYKNYARDRCPKCLSDDYIKIGEVGYID